MGNRGLGHDAMNRLATLRNTSKVAQEGTYQGYKNYETFTIAVIIENSQGDLEYWQERAKEIQEELSEGYEESEYWKPDEKVKYALADEMENQFREQKDEFNLPDPFGTLLNAALGEVSWDEIITSILSE